MGLGPGAVGGSRQRETATQEWGKENIRKAKCFKREKPTLVNAKVELSVYLGVHGFFSLTMDRRRPPEALLAKRDTADEGGL
jgi:hypothetical protein